MLNKKFQQEFFKDKYIHNIKFLVFIFSFASKHFKVL